MAPFQFSLKRLFISVASFAVAAWIATTLDKVGLGYLNVATVWRLTLIGAFAGIGIGGLFRHSFVGGVVGYIVALVTLIIVFVIQGITAFASLLGF